MTAISETLAWIDAANSSGEFARGMAGGVSISDLEGCLRVSSLVKLTRLPTLFCISGASPDRLPLLTAITPRSACGSPDTKRLGSSLGDVGNTGQFAEYCKRNATDPYIPAELSNMLHGRT